MDIKLYHKVQDNFLKGERVEGFLTELFWYNYYPGD